MSSVVCVSLEVCGKIKGRDPFIGITRTPIATAEASREADSAAAAMATHKIVVFGGDHCGPEVVAEGIKVLKAIEQHCPEAGKFELEEHLLGGVSFVPHRTIACPHVRCQVLTRSNSPKRSVLHKCTRHTVDGRGSCCGQGSGRGAAGRHRRSRVGPGLPGEARAGNPAAAQGDGHVRQSPAVRVRIADAGELFAA